MKGNILLFNKTSETGIIINESDKRYSYELSDWRSEGSPKEGMLVDFVEDNVNDCAKDICLLKAPIQFDFTQAKEGIGNLANSQNVSNILNLYTNGLHNTYGLVSVIFLFLTLFPSFISIPYDGSYSPWSEVGVLLFISLFITGSLFYGGARILYTRIASSVTLIIMLYFYLEIYDLLSSGDSLFGAYSQLSGENIVPRLFQLLDWGAYVNFVACLNLAFATYLKKYSASNTSV